VLLNIDDERFKEKIEIIPAAAVEHSGEEGTTQIHVSKGWRGKNSGMATCVEAENDSIGFVVQAITIDEALSNLGNRPVDLVKLDIEGFELQALRGAANLLASEGSRPRLIQAELNPGILKTTNFELVNYIESFGYLCYSTAALCPEERVTSRTEVIKHGDIFCESEGSRKRREIVPSAGWQTATECLSKVK
jgi:FkbM family methyltransferase